jgi:hypothetical protein
MAVAKAYQQDVEAILAKQHDQGGHFWATADGRWGKGSPFSTLDCVLMLTDVGVTRTHPAMKGAAKELFRGWTEDGRIRPAPKATTYPCHTADAARALGRLGFARDRRLTVTYEHLLDKQHTDGGWRCNVVKLGKSAKSDASNPGVTLHALDAFRFSPHLNREKRLDKAVHSLLAHWDTRKPLGPCSFGIGTLFMQVEFPLLRYNLFNYVYVLSFYDAARRHRTFEKALVTLEAKTVNGQIVVENPHRQLARFAFCAKGQPSKAATHRYREILKNIGD